MPKLKLKCLHCLKPAFSSLSMNFFPEGNIFTDSGKYLYAFLSLDIKEPIFGSKL